ncbi:hypothetical protein A2697_01020 [Candidatus Curtissbacteria bacterium RIFCSPHIGHO2_01_FULL_41_44]|uniref:Glycosyltransferase RgtA/B/C/D-like domain-containing protein n=1 Tax=Candidatus Curtissbacteria bacterium RIFCSPLOWO2_01_FULL_42_50 TaxID=1797730 RepID=A0A1F5H305_9BACT|nr:MAG: hypothetical protein A3C33_02320 [Candidatus Curtissbacteria bacterium RIFCSPHIGHO2_02_FULL_42_58]OGD94832.1 MAG: hypothetical protein A2697_01020 [Candidatus Curtissbacteria bacterium RIFCSPHIGHO2_01_FULL_41_44]OGD96433.1 MAG: hypothetical protein A3E71_02460 [Candidatus Curtissbacteria bacterium RIFCSPHIGHO2_12_FULL_42_33]OGD98459.1 MAG: hypothetical protein A3B54_04300 [Candidatus Curtissbacteria bacterium RIFCSPLOWO2_01_FULL_42_50]OGE02689.1 MAG: hypothetical protein A3G16_01785 [Ca
MDLIKWLKTQKIEFYLLLILLLTAAFFRFWQIKDYVVFLGDEGRDMLVAKRMIMDGKVPFLGPTASVGGFYLGPIYYWLAAPFLAIWRLDPVGPSYMVALFGVGTVFLLYKFLKDTAGLYPAFLASLLYATAPLIVRYSRSSWNPNPLPFFALLLIYSLYLAISRKNPLFFVLAGLCFGVVIQLHYLAIMLVPISFLIIVLNTNFRHLPKALLLITAGSLLSFSPFLIFEIKHHFPNFKTIYEFTTRGSTHGFKTYNYLWLTSNMGNILLEEITKLKETIITKIFFWVLSLGGIYGLAKNWQNKKNRLIFSIGVIWFLVGLLSLRFYSGQLFDYYFGFMFPAPFLLTGLVFSVVWQKNILKIASIIFTTAALIYFIANGFYRFPPNQLIKQTEDVANFVVEKSEGNPFNFALITDHNSDHAYRYFLEIAGHKPTELETMVTDQLLVVCESKKCAPLGHPTWEIAGFGRSEIKGEWELPNIGIRVFRLTHWPGVPSPSGKPAVKGI